MFDAYTIMVLALISFTFLDAENLVKDIIRQCRKEIKQIDLDKIASNHLVNKRRREQSQHAPYHHH